jgi:hypothetical protein
MADKEYPAGTLITFIAREGMCPDARRDDGQRGKVIEKTSYGNARILLFNSVKNYGGEAEWTTAWENIKPLKNTQLEFAFMDE